MTFLYRKNLQEDITGVIEATTGQLMAEYSYDAYGNVEILSNNDAGTALLGAIITVYNPLLYRGYAYSILGGTLAYYLGSRFYLPQLGRFLNADKHTDTDTGVIGTNMYAYCNNNPVMFVDPTGEVANFIKKILTNTSFILYRLKGIKKTIQTYKDAIRTTIDNKEKNLYGISINLELVKNFISFSDILHKFYELYGDKIFNELTTFTLNCFYSEKSRQFLFSFSCVENEIKKHLLGYWWYQGKNINLPIEFLPYYIENGKNSIGKACKSIEMSEFDVNSIKQAVAFGYYGGINTIYKNTSYDPYLHGKIRRFSVNENWSMPK